MERRTADALPFGDSGDDSGDRFRRPIPATMNGFAALRMPGLPLPRVRAEVLESRMRLTY